MIKFIIYMKNYHMIVCDMHKRLRLSLRGEPEAAGAFWEPCMRGKNQSPMRSISSSAEVMG